MHLFCIFCYAIVESVHFFGVDLYSFLDILCFGLGGRGHKNLYIVGAVKGE